MARNRKHKHPRDFSLRLVPLPEPPPPPPSPSPSPATDRATSSDTITSVPVCTAARRSSAESGAGGQVEEPAAGAAAALRTGLPAAAKENRAAGFSGDPSTWEGESKLLASAPLSC